MLIVAGFRDTREGRAAVDAALAQAKAHGATLEVVSVREAPSDSSGARTSTESDTTMQAALDRLQQELAAAGVDARTEVLTSATEAGPALVRHLTEVGADMVVIGMPRRSRVGKLLMGSTAQSILLDAPCPVLAIKDGND